MHPTETCRQIATQLLSLDMKNAAVHHDQLLTMTCAPAESSALLAAGLPAARFSRARQAASRSSGSPCRPSSSSAFSSRPPPGPVACTACSAPRPLPFAFAFLCPPDAELPVSIETLQPQSNHIDVQQILAGKPSPVYMLQTYKFFGALHWSLSYSSSCSHGPYFMLLQFKAAHAWQSRGQLEAAHA